MPWRPVVIWCEEADSSSQEYLFLMEEVQEREVVSFPRKLSWALPLYLLGSGHSGECTVCAPHKSSGVQRLQNLVVFPLVSAWSLLQHCALSGKKGLYSSSEVFIFFLIYPLLSLDKHICTQSFDLWILTVLFPITSLHFFVSFSLFLVSPSTSSTVFYRHD